jgi:hypothetical protein
MRRALLLAVLLAAAPALAQAPALPALREARAGVPVPPLRDGKYDRVEEMRRGGQLLMVVVTPPGGRPYYLVDGHFWRQRDPLDPGLHVPLWPVLLLD